jgi:hypothetical protein
MSLLLDSNHHKKNIDCYVLDDSVDDVSGNILLRIPLLIFVSCLENSMIKFILKTITEIICSILKQQQEEGTSNYNKWRPSLQSITEEEEEEEEEEDIVFNQEQEQAEKEEKEVSTQIMKASSQKEIFDDDDAVLIAAKVFSSTSSSSSSSSSTTVVANYYSIAIATAVPILITILSHRFTLPLLQ